MRNKGEYYIGGAQKGTRVRWAKDRRSGKGEVIKVKGPEFSPERTWIVRDDATGDEIECNINQIRFEKIPNRIKKQKYAERHGL